MGTFVSEDPEVAAFGEDLAFPLRLDDGGDLAVVAGVGNLLSALPIRACTERGEIPVLPDDGVDLTDIQNGLATPEELGALQARLTEQYRRDDRLAGVTVRVVEGSEPGETVAEIEARTRTGRILSTDVPFGSG